MIFARILPADLREPALGTGASDSGRGIKSATGTASTVGGGEASKALPHIAKSVELEAAGSEALGQQALAVAPAADDRLHLLAQGGHRRITGERRQSLPELGSERLEGSHAGIVAVADGGGFLVRDVVEGGEQAPAGLGGGFHQATPWIGTGAAESRLWSISLQALRTSVSRRSTSMTGSICLRRLASMRRRLK